MSDHPLDGFRGYRMPGYTQIPDQLLDEQLHILTHAELKVLLYIMRHTFGYKRDGDHLSARQIAEGISRRDGTRVDCGTGCGIATVRRVVKRLENLGLITVRRDQTQAGDADVNYYSVRLIDQGVVSPGHHRSVAATPGGGVARTPLKKEVQETRCSLSNNGHLSDAFFSAIAESKPSKKRRERALVIINDLTAEGFSEEVIHQAIRLAAERGARGPDLLPHVVGEAHATLEAREAEAAQRAERIAAHEEERERLEAEFQEELAAVEALPRQERDRLEAQCRTNLPPDISEKMLANVLPGMIAAKLRAVSK